MEYNKTVVVCFFLQKYGESIFLSGYLSIRRSRATYPCLKNTLSYFLVAPCSWVFGRSDSNLLKMSFFWIVLRLSSSFRPAKCCCWHEILHYWVMTKCSFLAFVSGYFASTSKWIILILWQQKPDKFVLSSFWLPSINTINIINFFARDADHPWVYLASHLVSMIVQFGILLFVLHYSTLFPWSCGAEPVARTVPRERIDQRSP